MLTNTDQVLLKLVEKEVIKRNGNNIHEVQAKFPTVIIDKIFMGEYSKVYISLPHIGLSDHIVLQFGNTGTTNKELVSTKSN